MFEWAVLNMEIPHQRPQEGQAIYYCLLPEDPSAEWSNGAGILLQCDFYKEQFAEVAVRARQNGMVVIWQPVPPRPKIPSQYRILRPSYCYPLSGSCEYADGGYCADHENERNKTCGHLYKASEISVF